MKNVVASIIMTVVFAIGCDQTNEVVAPQQPRVSMSFSNLPHLENGEGHYQLWATFLVHGNAARNDSPEHDSTSVSLGEFNVSEDGQHIVGLHGLPIRLTIPADQNPQLIDDIILTIQEDEHGLAKIHHDAPGPAILGGKVHGDASTGIADLDVSYSHALGSTFSSVIGKYTIIAPTSPVDSNSGVWFTEQQGTTLSAGLQNLPTLPAGWTYEGWIVIPIIEVHGDKPAGFQYFSTGKFLRADSADFDGAGPGRGPGVGYNFPGQDFINPPASLVKPDLRFSVCMITAEPEPDNATSPFFLQLLSRPMSPTPLPQGSALLMENVAGRSFPRAKVTIVRAGY
jgi:hypothetical protein